MIFWESRKPRGFNHEFIYSRGKKPLRASFDFHENGRRRQSMAVKWVVVVMIAVLFLALLSLFIF